MMSIDYKQLPGIVPYERSDSAAHLTFLVMRGNLFFMKQLIFFAAGAVFVIVGVLLCLLVGKLMKRRQQTDQVRNGSGFCPARRSRSPAHPSVISETQRSNFLLYQGSSIRLSG